MKKKIMILLTVLLSIFISHQLYVFFVDSDDSLKPMYLVPEDAVYILESEKPVQNWEDISDSDIWEHLKGNEFINSTYQNVIKLDSIFSNKKKVFNIIGNRQIVVSSHVYKQKKTALFYVVDLKKIAKLNLLKNNLKSFVNSNFKVSARQYKDHKITEILDLKTKKTLHIAFIKNLMVLSYVHTLVEASIDQYNEPKIGRDLNFIEIESKVENTNMFRLYFQYKYIEDFIKVFSDKTNTITQTLGKSLNYSGFNFELDNHSIRANGYTNTSLKSSAYLKALKSSGKARRTAYKIIPKKTASYVSFGFSSFEKVHENFELLLKESPEQFNTYNKNLKKVENLLNIDVKKDFIDWIDDEIALVQLHSSVSKSKKHVALIIKSKDIDDSKERLEHIVTQIRKKTPVKFKAVNYKGYAINFMSIKGFFKLLFGNLFESIEKPYFIIIDDYVVFSNNPNTLKTIIDQNIAEETLDNTDDFMDFNDKFDSKSNLFIYINTPILYDGLYQFLDYNTKKELKKNADYITCFSQLGLQLVASNDMFKSELIIEFQNPEAIKTNSFFSTLVTKKPITKENTPETAPVVTDKLFDIPEIHPNDFTLKEFKTLYDNGKTRYKVDLKDGLKHGKYHEYYPNGNLKISGKYRKNKQVGLWKAFDVNEELILKKRF